MLTPHVTPCARIAGHTHVVDQDDLLAALSHVEAQVHQLAGLDGLTADDVQVIAVQDVIRDRRAVEAALRRVGSAPVRAALRDAPALAGALAREEVLPADVVAVEVLRGGDVVLFTR